MCDCSEGVSCQTIVDAARFRELQPSLGLATCASATSVGPERNIARSLNGKRASGASTQEAMQRDPGSARSGIVQCLDPQGAMFA